jgi:hypothetical protein
VRCAAADMGDPALGKRRVGQFWHVRAAETNCRHGLADRTHQTCLWGRGNFTIIARS